MILSGKQENANDFYKAAKRCGWFRLHNEQRNDQASRENEPLFIPEMVNFSFACELYLKAIVEATRMDMKKTHNIHKLFYLLPEADRKAIIDKWRETAGENIPDCDYTRQMFSNNLEAVADVFARFRYTDEWVGSTINLQHSFTSEQFANLSPLSKQRQIGSPPIYCGFLEQLAEALKAHSEKISKTETEHS